MHLQLCFSTQTVFQVLAPSSGSTGIQRGTPSYLMQPARRILDTSSFGLASQSQECRLKGIFCVWRIAQDASAGSPYHGAMPPNQRLECRLITILGKTSHQLRIATWV